MTTVERSSGPGREVPGLSSTLVSEWSKVRSLRSARIIIVVAACLTVGITALISLLGAGDSLAETQRDGTFDVIFFSSFLGIWTFGVLGAHVVAFEYSSGIVSSTLVVTPRRWRVLAAKLVIVAGLAIGAGVVISFANFFITQAALAASGQDTLSLVDDGMLHAVAVYIPAATVVQALLCASVAIFVRRAGAATVIVILLGTLPVAVAPLLGDWWAQTVPRLLPGAAAESLAGVATPGSPGHLPVPLAALVLAGWLAAFISAAFARFARRDA